MPSPGASVLSVSGRDLRHVRVGYAAGANSNALDPTIYAFAGQALPCYNPSVTAVKFINSRDIVTNSLVELTLDADLSPGIQYQLVMSVYTGTPVSQGTFTAYSPNWPPTRSMQLWDVIPDINKAEDTTEHLQRFVLCIQDQLDVVLASVDQWADILDPDRAPENFLDVILKDLGNPFAFEDLQENEKRLLARVLVKLYQLKGTDLAIIAAIRLFLGFESQINLFRNSGSRLSSNGVSFDLLNDSFVLGGGTVYDFALTVATPESRDLTTTEINRIVRIVNVVKPVNARLLQPLFTGAVAPPRVQISGNSTAVTVSWGATIEQPDNWRVYFRLSAPNVSPFNTVRNVEVSGSTFSQTFSTPIGSDAPASTYFFVVVPVTGGKRGFRSEVEVRNNLAAPTAVTATAGVRSVTISWAEVTGATSYRVYKTLDISGSTSTPVTADYIYDVLGGDLEFHDTGLFPGIAAHYCVVARTKDAEGFYSTSVTGTPL